MKKILFLVVVMFTSVCYGQNLSISVSSELVEDLTDLDARAYFPKYDYNDQLCALIKVTLTNKLKNPLVLEVGGLGVVSREVKESGEIWFYVPAQVKNLSFKCAEYKAPPQIPVNLEEGTVYRITLDPDAIIIPIKTDVLTSNYLKLRISEPGSFLSLGKTKEYTLLTRHIDGYELDELLDYGTYYYKVEHPLFETYEGEVTINDLSPKRSVKLKPAYGYLSVNSKPSGATVYLNDKKIGTTPCVVDDRLPKGVVVLQLELDDYHPVKTNITIPGDGSRQTITQTLTPRFANVTLVCEDAEAEIWIDRQYKGKGRWTGRLGSTSKHFVETKRLNHIDQTEKFAVVDGESKTIKLKSPIPLYGTINLTSNPTECEIKIDGKIIGETPYIGKVLVGDHTITLSKDGYIRETFPVTVENNKTLSLTKELKKGKMKVSVSVTCEDYLSEIYLNGKYYARGKWKGVLEEGDYVFEARRGGCVPSKLEKNISADMKNPCNITLSKPREAFGTLSIKTKSHASIKLRNEMETSYKTYSVEELQEKQLPIGTYLAYASKADYEDSKEQCFMIEEDHTTSVRLPMKSRFTPMQRLGKWCFDPTRFSSSTHFPELTYSLGDEREYWGVNYDWLRGRIGIHSALTVDDRSDIGVYMGPMFRFNLFKRVDTHLYTGVGYDFGLEEKIYECGIRIADSYLATDISCASLSLGVKYVDRTGEIIPTIGISPLIPIAPLMEYDDDSTLFGLGMFYGFIDEGVVGFTISDWNLDYLWGWYGSASFCSNCGDVISYLTGPTINLFHTPLFLYGGVGVVGEEFGYEVGISLAGCLSAGYQFNDSEGFFTLGLNIPINQM